MSRSAEIKARAWATRRAKYGEKGHPGTPGLYARASKPVGERLQAKLRLDPDTGCLNFTGALVDGGYGSLRIGGRGSPQVRAHRVAYEAAKGPIPSGLEIDHLCRNRRCCNPDHLEAVTPRVNTLRGTSPSSLNAAKDRCKRGHEFTAENTYQPPRGGRQCRICRTASRRELYLAEKRRNALTALDEPLPPPPQRRGE